MITDIEIHKTDLRTMMQKPEMLNFRILRFTWIPHEVSHGVYMELAEQEGEAKNRFCRGR
ncbi:MAG: hypothetical protein K9K78_08155 [Spirochaetales bacterium]|nr:hypothetical protein [Spirochaetales bacterium]